MILGVEIALIVFGIMALAKGELKIGKTKSVKGGAARLLGLVGLLPIPLALVIILGMKLTQDQQTTAILIELGIVVACAVVMFGVGAALATPIEEPVHRRARNVEGEDMLDLSNDSRRS